MSYYGGNKSVENEGNSFLFFNQMKHDLNHTYKNIKVTRSYQGIILIMISIVLQ